MLKAWAEWKERCALDLCSGDTRRMLQAFARSRFARCLERCSVAADSPTHENPWHLFETYAAATETRAGKRYKDWIFARARTSGSDPLAAIEGGVSLIIRSAVREFTAAECSPRNTLSLNRPLHGDDGAAITLLDILPAQMDPVSEICLREYESLASRHAREFLAEMSDRERIAVVARQIGVSLAHRSVEKEAGCKKSVLATAYRDVMTRIAARLQANYPDDDPESVLTLALMTVKELTGALIEHMTSDKLHARLFSLAGERHLELAKT